MSINEIIVYLMVAFMVLGAADRIIGNRFGLGEKFEEGIIAMGSLALSMIGIPLFGGFVSKLYFASAAVPTGMTAMILLTIALSTVLNALYYVPALLAIWVKPPAEDEALVLADVHPGDLAADRAFTAAAAILIVGIFVLGIFYHPITDLIEAGVRLI